MKSRFIKILLVLLLILPAFAPWFPHEMIHALHDQHQSHHANKAYADGAEKHHQSKLVHKEQQTPHHPLRLDAVAYFDDYLHSDLQRPDLVVFKAPVRTFLDIDFELAFGFSLEQRSNLAANKNRAPPDWLSARLSHTPLYLSTQRLRI
ncbi:MAG: hypothetical protein HN578_15065 [Rhodospirillales bacterium]|nr:hypothetical protein [Rhodospirillales bacterium]